MAAPALSQPQRLDRCKRPEMGWTMGFEPTASWATTRCSNQTELRPPSTKTAPAHQRGCGAPGRIRTCNPRLRRPMLYPIELRAQEHPSDPPGGTARGRGRGIRTPDFLLPKQVRYQAALYPVLPSRPGTDRRAKNRGAIIRAALHGSQTPPSADGTRAAHASRLQTPAACRSHRISSSAARDHAAHGPFPASATRGATRSSWAHPTSPVVP